MIRCPDSKAVEFEIVGKHDLEVLQRQKRRRIQFLTDDKVEFFGKSVFDALCSTCLCLHESLQLFVRDSFKQMVIDVERRSEQLIAWRSSFAKVNSLISFQTFVCSQDNIEVTPSWHLQLLPQEGIDFVA